MRLLAFLLITTEIFILFNLALGGGDDDDDGSYNHEPPSLADKQPDDIANSYNDQKEVIRDGGREGGPVYGSWRPPLSSPLHEPHEEEGEELPEEGEDLQGALGGVKEIQEEETETSDRYHRSSQALLDGNVVAVSAINNKAAEQQSTTTSKTNPLIESGATGTQQPEAPQLEDQARERDKQEQYLEKEDTTITTTKRQQDESHNEYRVYKHHHNNNGRNIRPLFSVENHEGKSRLRHKNDWCHRDCNINGHNDQDHHHHSICASDGRLYASMCQLRRHSCRHNIHLFKRPKVYCWQMTNRIGGGLASAGSGSNSSEEVRIVELKRRCNRLEYEKMKLLLLREFNGDTNLMFKYFDSNGDDFIEAHELWPKRDTESNKLIYAQVWGDHSSRCQSALEMMHHRPNGNQHKYYRGLIEGQSKCWFFLDFAFEPQFPTNPCSLSHLMLFDLHHPNNKFTFDTFQKAFVDLKSQEQTIDTQSSYNKQLGNSAEPIKMVTTLNIDLGETRALNCFGHTNKKRNLSGQFSIEDNNNVVGSEVDGDEGSFEDSVGIIDDDTKCTWTRYNLNLGAIQDPHIHIEKRIIAQKSEVAKENRNSHDLTLHLKDAQLYLSGQFKCVCHLKKKARNFEHTFNIRVLAEPRVNVRPHFQWSLPNSRISFECHYDHIDTCNGQSSDKRETSAGDRSSSRPNDLTEEALEGERGQFGFKIKWLKNNEELIVDSKKLNVLTLDNINPNNNDENNTIADSSSDSSFSYSSTADAIPGNIGSIRPVVVDQQQQESSAPSKPKLSQSSLRASITMASSRLTIENLLLNDTGHYICHVEVPATDIANNNNSSHFTRIPSKDNNKVLYGQDHGILSVQERPKSDPSEENLDGTNLWMFHDNGISIYRLQNDDGQEMELLREINGHSLVSGEVDGNWNQLTLCGGLNPEQVVICEWSDNALHIDVNKQDTKQFSKARKYIYVGQPNLNRIIVMDGLKFEIVAIINTEPQPRKLHLYKPSKVHLSKWVRRHLSPVANARWLSAIGTHAHSLKSTPESRLYSNKPSLSPKQERFVNKQYTARARRSSSSSYSSLATNQMPSALIQHDIWLLCYGQPLIVDPSGDERLEDSNNSFYPPPPSFGGGILASNTTTNSKQNHKRSSGSTIQPFTPRLYTAGPPFAWSVWPNKESKLRNRKSVHIIQSTFFPTGQVSHHHHPEVDDTGREFSHREMNDTLVGEFKRSTVLTTHHVFAGISSNARSPRYLTSAQSDLVQDLFVPPKPYSVERNDRHKIHYAYVTHYNERRLFRVSMDEYRYDREIDLQDCDPVNLITTAQGLLVIQCRAPITHNLIGQLVLDQLTSSRIEFNANIRAQESYLSPDNRYLVSIYTNSTAYTDPHYSIKRKRSTGEQQQSKRRQSIIYVQLVTVSGLKFQYEIKTSLEISQCLFVWKDGYYAAIFVSTNRRDQQSEILSLRLADSRLELMARVPGLISVTRHKEQLIVSPELRLAALSTNQGTYVVDLEDNRVSQSLRHHQSPPTLLWV